jgi:nitrogen-specific signal transduction histidine kinase
VAWVAQQLQLTLARQRTIEVMSDLTLAISTEINSALQTIVGQCDLLMRTHDEPMLRSDLATVVDQARRISALLERMRAEARQRMKETRAPAQRGV